MNLWSLLLPFKWIAIGVGEVFRGIFYLLKGILSFLGSLFESLFKGIIIAGRGIGLLFKDIIFKSLFLSVKWIVLKIVLFLSLIFGGLKYIVKGLAKILNLIVLGLSKVLTFIVIGVAKTIKFIVLGLVNALKFIFINTIEGFITVIKLLALGFKYIITYLYKGLSFVIKYLFMAIKYIALYLYKSLFYVVKYILIGIKHFFIYLYKALSLIFKYIFIAVKTIIIYLGKFLKFIFVGLIYKYFGALINVLLDAFLAVLKFIIKIPGAIWKGIKSATIALYKAIISPFVYLRKNFGRIIGDTIKKIKNAIKKFFAAAIAFPGKTQTRVKEWFYNLSFIKDIRNRREMKHQALLIDFDAEDSARSERKLTYRYVARNADGKIEKGSLGAFSKLDVHSYLLSEGYEVYKIEPMKGINVSIGGPTYKIKTADLVFFLTQLSTYVKSGIPLVDSIKILGKQARKGKNKGLYKGIIYDLTMGDSFSESLEKQGSSFPKLLVNMIKASELAGNLSETLDDMAEYYTSVSKTRKQMKSAMTYPAVISVFAISVVVFILTFVIPSFIEMYKDADAEVPAITTFIINLSDFLVNNYIWLIIGVIIVLAGLYYMFKNIKVFRMIVQWLMMHMPIMSKIIIYNEVTMFAKTFASLWNHNVFITSSMEILTKITDNEIYKMLIFDAITNVARGDAVSTAFKDHWAFPIVAYEMLVTGERTGQPGPMMDKVATYYQEEHENAINQVKAFIEPALIIFLAVVVGVILLAIVIPMFSIYGEIGLSE